MAAVSARRHKRGVSASHSLLLFSSASGSSTITFLLESKRPLTPATTLFPPPPTSPHPASSDIIEFSTSPLSFFHQPWLREYVPHPPTDLPIHLHWQGHSKFGVFDFDTAGARRAVDFSLVADGMVAWRYRWVKGGGVQVPEWTGS